MNGDDLATSFVTRIRWDHLPSRVQRATPLALLDTLRATMLGTLTPISRITAGYAEQR